MAVNPLLVLPVEKAKEHLNKEQMAAPGGDDELVDMIGAAVERVERHLGDRQLGPGATYSELMACKTVLAEYWRTQNPARATRAGYGGSQGPMADDGPTAPVSLQVKLTALLGPAVAPAAEQPGGSFPEPQPWPDPIRVGSRQVWPW